MMQTTIQQQNEIEEIQYPEMHDLRWLADTSFKVEKLREYIQGNVEFNKLHGRTENDLSYQMNTISALETIEDNLSDDISDEVTSHPAYQWLVQIDGIDHEYIGKILGSIRFWPPKKNTMNEGTGKSRWAHTRGALLMYCGLGNSVITKYPNSSKIRESNEKLNKYIYEQIDSILMAKSHYYTYFQSELSAATFQHINDGYELNDYVNSQLEQRAKKATAILFICHIYEIVKIELDPAKDLKNIQSIQNIDDIYNDPMTMIGKI